MPRFWQPFPCKPDSAPIKPHAAASPHRPGQVQRARSRAQAAARAIARGWKKVRPKDLVRRLPITDGGDGFGEVMGQLWGAEGALDQTMDAAHRSARARWWWEPKSRTAIIESAEYRAGKTPGLSSVRARHVRSGRGHPGAAVKGARRCLIGIAAARPTTAASAWRGALGWKFLDAQGEPITSWDAAAHAGELLPPQKSAGLQNLIVGRGRAEIRSWARGAARAFMDRKRD